MHNRKWLLIVLLLSSALGAVAQKTKKVSVSHEEPPAYKETYYVLRDSFTIKHGEYKQIAKGFSVRGQFDHNTKTGVWEYYDRDGNVEQKIDFTTGTVIFAKPFLMKDCRLKADSLKQPTELPFLLGGTSRYMRHLQSTVRYSAEAKRRGVQGKAFISATITEKGEITEEKIVSGPGYGLNEEALRVIQLLPDEWIPGKVNGQSVATTLVLAVFFKLAN